MGIFSFFPSLPVLIAFFVTSFEGNFLTRQIILDGRQVQLSFFGRLEIEHLHFDEGNHCV